MDKEADLSNLNIPSWALILISFVFSTFALSDAIKTVGWDIEQIVTSSVFFLNEQEQLSRDSTASTNITE